MKKSINFIQLEEDIENIKKQISFSKEDIERYNKMSEKFLKDKLIVVMEDN